MQHLERIPVREVIESVEISVALFAQSRGPRFFLRAPMGTT